MNWYKYKFSSIAGDVIGKWLLQCANYFGPEQEKLLMEDINGCVGPFDDLGVAVNEGIMNYQTRTGRQQLSPAQNQMLTALQNMHGSQSIQQNNGLNPPTEV